MVNAFLAQQCAKLTMSARISSAHKTLLLGSAEMASPFCPWRLHFNG
jgi:hypothetical protein